MTVIPGVNGQPGLMYAAGGGGTFPPTEFSLYDASTPTQLKVGVLFGNVAAYTFSTGVQPWPDDYNSANAYLYEFDVSADGCAWIEAVNDTSGATYSVSSLAMGNGATVPDNTGDTGYLVLGNWSVTAGKLKILSGLGANGKGNQLYNFCGGAHFWYSGA